MKSEPVAATIQEAVDGYREKSDEDREGRTGRIGRHLGAVNHGSGVQVGRTIEPPWRTVAEQSGRNVKNHTHLTVARHLREKTHTSMLVVTIREDEERGICSAAFNELFQTVNDRLEERRVVVIVLNKQSAIWKDASIETLSREWSQTTDA